MGFIRGFYAEGVGPSEGLDIYRDIQHNLGETAIRDSRWFELYSQYVDTYASRPGQLGLDPFALPGPEMYDEWRFGKGGQYATQVEIQVIDRDTGDWLTKQHTFVTDEPHTPADAEADAFALFGDVDTQNDYGETMVGALAVSFATTIPYGAP